MLDPRNGILYVGTDIGVFHSTDGGATWRRFGVGMPNVQVKDLELNLTTNTLLAGTYGRSVYQLFLDIAETSDRARRRRRARPWAAPSVWAGNVVIDGDHGDELGDTRRLRRSRTCRTRCRSRRINFVGQISDFDPDRPGAVGDQGRPGRRDPLRLEHLRAATRPSRKAPRRSTTITRWACNVEGTIGGRRRGARTALEPRPRTDHFERPRPVVQRPLHRQPAQRRRRQYLYRPADAHHRRHHRRRLRHRTRRSPSPARSTAPRA